jgi:hypothetical protein
VENQSSASDTESNKSHNNIVTVEVNNKIITQR